MIETIHVPALPASAQWAYFKSCRKTGEYAHAIAAVVIDPIAGTARLVIGAIEAAPIVIKNPLELFGGRIAGDYKERFDPRVADAILAKAGIANAAQRHIHVNVLKRAIHGAAA
jgi:carbon-monoxide dehydrogenase medium subunit